MRKAVSITTSLLIILIVYAVFVEPLWLEVTHHHISGKTTLPIKIAHVTDLHIKRLGPLETKLLKVLAEEKPDIILLTGDQTDSESGLPALRGFINNLTAPLGTWVVRGNWENWLPMKQEDAFYNSVDARLLINETVHLRRGFSLRGFDDSSSGNPLMPEQRSLANDEFMICMFHSPEFFTRADDVCDLSLAGHTHGGQVRLPIFGAVWLPKGTGPFVAGWYQRKEARMYVSRGTGTSILPIRLLSRPELAFITVNPE